MFMLLDAYGSTLQGTFSRESVILLCYLDQYAIQSLFYILRSVLQSMFASKHVCFPYQIVRHLILHKRLICHLKKSISGHK